MVEIYVDGSYEEVSRVSGYGVVVVEDNKVVCQSYQALPKSSPYNESRNVYGEISGAMKAVLLAKERGYKDICICYDYIGIELWAIGRWKAKKELTQGYAQFMKDAMEEINITFKKIKGHSGNPYNELADKLAGKATGAV